jgi:hypothetical protein
MNRKRMALAGALWLAFTACIPYLVVYGFGVDSPLGRALATGIGIYSTIVAMGWAALRPEIAFADGLASSTDREEALSIQRQRNIRAFRYFFAFLGTLLGLGLGLPLAMDLGAYLSTGKSARVRGQVETVRAPFLGAYQLSQDIRLGQEDYTLMFYPGIAAKPGEPVELEILPRSRLVLSIIRQ